MAELSPFTFRQADGWLHRCDARTKLVVLAALGLVSLKSAPAGLAVASACALAALLPLVRRASDLVRGLAPLALLLALVVGVRAMVVPGDALFHLGPVAVSRQGLFQGAVIAWRLALLIVWGMLLTATTPTGRVRAAVAWFLAPVPGIDGRKVATMLGLLVRFLPLVHNHALQVAEAQKARCVQLRKNPLRRTVAWIMPVMRRTFVTADRLAMAMEARCFDPRRPPQPLHGSRSDLALVLVAGLLAAVMMVIR